MTGPVESEERKRRKSMKKQILTVAAALVFAAIAPAASHAQQVTQAKVPFAFQAADTRMPAGEYQIRRASSSSKAVQHIQRTDSSASTFVLTYAADLRNNNAAAKLVFHCYSDECFLSEIWSGNGEGLKLTESRREKHLSRSEAENELAVVSVPLTVTP
jgi:hypothetical protein